MGNGTRYPTGIIDGVNHVEAGSAMLVAGATTITTQLVRVRSVTATAGATGLDLRVSTGAGANKNKFTVTDANGLAKKVFYVAVGPRTTQYATSELA